MRRCALALVAALMAHAFGRVSADVMWSWQALRSQRDRKGRFFGSGAPDQRKVLAALHAIEHASRVGRINDLERRVREDPAELATRHLLGLAYQRRGRFGEAMAQFRRILAFDRTHRCRLDLIGLYESARRPDLAAQELAEFVRLNPKAAEPRKRLAHLYDRLGRRGKAVRVRRELAALAPGDHGLQIGLARALLKAGRPEEAAEAARAAIRLKPDDPATRFELTKCLRALGQRNAARKELAALAEKHKGTRALWHLALLRLGDGEFEQARGDFEKALTTVGRKATLLAGAAAAAQGSGDADAAANYCQGLRKQGEAAAAAELLASLWLGRGDEAGLNAACGSMPGVDASVVEAWQALFAVARPLPNTRRKVALRISLARVFRIAGWFPEAIDAAEEAEKALPEDVLLATMLAGCYAAAGQRDKELSLLERLAKEHPQSDLAAIALAHAYAARRRHPEAAATCRGLLERSPDHRRGRLLMASLAMQYGDYANAAIHCRRILERHGADRVALRLLVDALTAKESFRDAAKSIEGFAKRDKDYEPDAAERIVLAIGRGVGGPPLRRCQAALLMAPWDPRLRRLAAVLLLRDGNSPAALGHLHAAALVEPTHFQGQWLLAGVAERLGLAPVALAAYRGLATAAPGNVAVQLRLADALSRSGRWAEALRVLRKLAPGDPTVRRQVQARLAHQYWLRHDLEGALRVATAVLQEEPRHREAARVALRVYRARGDLKAAGRLCALVASAGDAPEFSRELGVIRLLQGRPEEAADRLAKAAPGAGAAVDRSLLLTRAAALLAVGKRDDAAKLALEAETMPGGDLLDASALAVSFVAAGDNDAAQRQLDRVGEASGDVAAWIRAALPQLKGKPALAKAYLRAAAARRHGWLDAAAGALDAARRLAPRQPLLLYAALATALDARKPRAALSHAQQLVEAAPKAGMAHYLRGRALEAAGQAAAALDAYATAAKSLGKHSPHVWLRIARRLEDGERHAEAAEAYRALLAMHPDDANICNNLAWLFTKAMPDRLDEAQRLAAKAVKLQPKSAAFHDTLAWVYLLRRDLDAAAKHFIQALSFDADKASSYAGLGMVYFKQKTRERARRCLEYALTRKPDLHDAETLRATLDLLKPKRKLPSAPKPEAKAEAPPAPAKRAP